MDIQFKDWKSFACFFSAEYCQAFLRKCYQKGGVENPAKSEKSSV
ncbi:hypothetical protein PH210_06290 [Paenibacillus sp. BSR1-1]|nr:hypothetical protein [Paenibacillus sp. BSR1-1]MDN3015815.1 hypothetical protein [Paenibacillus sp. BSR1-1]